MRKIAIGVVIGIVSVVLLYWFYTQRQNQAQVVENTQLIQEQIKNVSKIVVTEGYFSEIITYKDVKKYLGDWITFDKKALIIVNAEVLIAYDLHQITYDIQPDSKTLVIGNIPQPEVKIYPKITYYDLVQSQFNTFTSEDHNKIRSKADQIIKQKVQQSALVSNAQNRLISELSKMLILTNSMQWKLLYKEKIIQTENDWNTLDDIK